MRAVAPASVLLVEPDSLMRSTIVGVVRALGLAELRQASSYDAAHQLLKTTHFDALIIALADDGNGMQLIEAVRDGSACCATNCPIAVMAGHCSVERAMAMVALQVRRVILKPFKVKTVLETIGQLAGQASPGTQPAGAS